MSRIIDNLTSAINTWNSKLAEIWLLLTESPETFKGGDKGAKDFFRIRKVVAQAAAL